MNRLVKAEDSENTYRHFVDDITKTYLDIATGYMCPVIEVQANSLEDAENELDIVLKSRYRVVDDVNY